ncbi:hypothetical protein D9615_006250 [Tricholomella constricta]|uniref:DUF6534 domain-containing protein n=1 Tax=Tricholomella constricta TaxID=117010 RepID=A0A8H5M3K7_9AGAR|nr:hypothetical protein D9615_006250 [Tricholomella constricta]
MDPTSQAPPPQIPANIASIAGPPLIGIMLNWFLYGILVMQTYVYYQCFSEDRFKIKVLVYGIFCLDTVQSVLGTADAFHWFAKGFGNMVMLSDPYISAFDAPILDGIIAFIVQTFFCWRIYVLQKSWFFSGLVFFVAVTGFAGALATGVSAFQLGNLQLLNTLKWQLCLWLAGNALADTLIAGIMTFMLLRSRTREHQQTDSILVRLVRLTVETNSVTASVAIAVLVCLLAIPVSTQLLSIYSNNLPPTAQENPSISMAPAYALGKLYSNTLLAVFNNRVYMSSKGLYARSTASMSTGIDLKFRNPSTSQGQTTRTQLDTHKEPYRIEVFRETEVTNDLGLKDFGGKRMSTPTREELDHRAHAV